MKVAQEFVVYFLFMKVASAVRRSAWCERVGEAKVKVKACAVGELNPDLILGRDEP